MKKENVVSLRVGGKTFSLTREEAEKLSGMLLNTNAGNNGEVMYYTAGHSNGQSTGTIVVQGLESEQYAQEQPGAIETDC